ncbi:Hsp70 family protein [Nocardia sp. NPDC057353]|uniref:Hsp70 family protein n=1 Tax=Nocardia sp. NPDC057353 TaxID=3346104 RepID=UPI00362F9A75
MRTSLGISAGNDVVCSATVATAPNGAQTFDYRVVSTDAAHSDLGDLVTSSIELMTTQLPATHPREPVHPVGPRFTELHEPVQAEAPTSVAVAYRGKEQEQIIRAATGRQRDLRMVPEFTAALTYLRHTGLLDRYATVAVVDLGATGLTVTVADRADGTVLVAERTSLLSGNAIDELIYRHLVDQHFARRGTRPNRTTLVNRARAAKEHLSVTPAVTVDHVAGRPLKLTREDFEYLIARLLGDIAEFTAIAAERAGRLPEAVTVIGGGANIPAVLSALHDRLGIPVLTVRDPDAVIAKGAALVADQAQLVAEAPAAAVRADTSGRTVTKVAGVLVGALVVVGLVIGYGVRELAPIADEEISPAGTTSSGGVPPTTPPVTPTPVLAPGTTAEPPAPSSAAPPPVVVTTSRPAGPTSPTLRPDPNMPPIPFPNSLGPGLEIPTSVPGRVADPTPAAPNAQTPAESTMPLAPPVDSGSASGETTTAESSTPLPTLAVPR